MKIHSPMVPTADMHTYSRVGRTNAVASTGSAQTAGRAAEVHSSDFLSELHAAARATLAGKEIDGLRQWALGVQTRANHNKAACALANKLARICYATLRDGQLYGEPLRRPEKKISRTSFAIAA